VTHTAGRRHAPLFFKIAGLALLIGMTPPVAGTVAHGQAGAAVSKFDTASVRRNTVAEVEREATDRISAGVARPPGRARTLPGGVVLGQAMTLRELIRDAYGYRNRASSDVVGGPSWLDTDRYDFQAKTSIELPQTGVGGLPPDAERLLQALLAERFKLKIRKETRDRPIFELVLARPDGTPGPNLRKSAGQCRSFYQAVPVVASRDNPPRPACPFQLAGGVFATLNLTMEELARFLPAFPSINTTVVDKTGLQGGYDLQVLYQLADLAANRTPQMMERPLFNDALEPQLGLKLRPAQGPVEMLIVESAERPVDN
jgi:uncharacterized protein (TIGR03435 family)